MAIPALRVFVSSTSNDLKPYRDVVIRGIDLLGQGTEKMESFGADPCAPFDVCMKHVDDSDALVVVVAHRYGWVPTRNEGGDGETSITWHEVNRALSASKPVFASLVDETAPWDDALRDTDSVGWAGRPSTIGSWFIGRERELDELAMLLRQHRTVVVAGGTGTGKSRLAAEYSVRARARGFWSAAGSSVELTLAGLAPQLHVAQDARTSAERATAVEAALRALPRDTLWIIDDLPSVEMCIPLANRCGAAHLLVTTRDDRRHLLGTWGLLSLRCIEHGPAAELLRSRGYQDREDLGELAEAVGRLPLALEALAVQLGRSSGPFPAARLLGACLVNSG